MEDKKLENLEGVKITDKELDAIYLYLDIQFDTMSEEEKLLWINILKKIDGEFYESTSNGSDRLQALQNSEGSA